MTQYYLRTDIEDTVREARIALFDGREIGRSDSVPITMGIIRAHAVAHGHAETDNRYQLETYRVQKVRTSWAKKGDTNALR